MIDKDMARLRAENGYDFGAAISALAEGAAEAFRVLQRIQYGRPWDRIAACCDGLQSSASGACRPQA